jgi:hypothetical protein
VFGEKFLIYKVFPDVLNNCFKLLEKYDDVIVSVLNLKVL